MHFKVYLAGAIDGLAVEEANGWRKQAMEILGEHCIDALNPMQRHLQDYKDLERIEPWVVGSIVSADEIFYGDLVLLNQSNLVLVNLANYIGGIGTPWEMGYAFAMGKTIVSFGPEARMRHPFVSRCGVTFTKLEDALDWIVGLAD
jgi:nucleoside 2-deoxyribosyltransferase